MKRLAAAIALALAFAAPAAADVRSILVCDNKAINGTGVNGGVTDCLAADISQARYFSFQAKCTDSGDSDISVSFDWVGGSALQGATLAVPLLTGSTPMSQLRSTFTTEDTWTILQTIQPPVSPVGTIRITSAQADADQTCTVILNLGD